MQVASYFPYSGTFYHVINAVDNVSPEGGLYGSPLEAACAAGHFKYVVQLLAKVADPKYRGGILGSPLEAALTAQFFTISDELKSKGARLNCFGSSLWQAGWLKLRKENKHIATQFENKLISSCNVPTELTLEQQLLVAVTQIAEKACT